jgi:hypothetical protein
MGSYSGFSGKSFSFGAQASSYRSNEKGTGYYSSHASVASTIKPKQTAISETFGTGDRVKHGKFGNDTVLSAKPMGADIMYEIAFDEFGTKKLMGTYAKLTKE